ncbi:MULTISPECIES: glycosyltransferase [unclassified Synechococcus]|uniref:CgeB family protein n=1 Tax=unclassified Synechococcus TaxID=2626047 RepID=UPI0039AF21CD
MRSRLADFKTSPDVIWVNSGEYFGSRILKWLRLEYRCKIVLYQNDDPTGFRDGNRFISLLNALPFYDLCVFVRAETTLEALSLGAKQVLRVFPSYDEICHNFDVNNLSQSHEAKLVVSFVGTLIPNEKRDKFLVNLIQAGLPLTLVGNKWSRSSLWPKLKRIYEGSALTGNDYSIALRNAAISLGFLSHGNRDLVTRRSFETPACGGLLCAERTSEHQLLYEDGREAVFWDSEDECILQCKKLLNDKLERDRICNIGNEHVRSMGAGNEDICLHILSVLLDQNLHNYDASNCLNTPNPVSHADI